MGSTDTTPTTATLLLLSGFVRGAIADAINLASEGQTTAIDPTRFRYCSKPSTAEREIGCADLPRKSGAELAGREPGSAGLDNPRSGGQHGGRGNSHPTVKSIDLMRYLCTMITPPGGAVLDMFAGSGTTGMAAAIGGFRFLGCELLPDHHAIACARIAAAERGDVVILDGKAALNPRAQRGQGTLSL